MKINKKPELLAPIQDYTSLHAAINSGADAVFFGIKGFNMRAGAKNFTTADLPKIAKIAKARNESQELKEKLQKAIQKEDFEEAARLRDKIRELDKKSDK